MLLVYLLLSVFVVYCWVERRRYLRQIENLKGPKGWPLIGNYLDLKDRDNGVEMGMRDTKLYGKTYKVFIGWVPVILTSDAKLLEIALGSNRLTTKSDDYKFFERWFGDGLLTSSGKKWHSHRKILTPAFHYNILEDFVKVFEKRGKFLVENLSKHLDGHSFNVFKLITLYTLDVICETAMGTTVDAQTNSDHVYFNSVKELCLQVSDRTLSLLTRFDFIYKKLRLYKRELELVTIIKNFSTGIIKARREFLKNNQQEVHKNRSTFMDILLNSTVDGEPLSDEDIREEVDTFLFEGHDTTAIALSMLVYNIAHHPHVQTRILSEIRHIFGSDIDRQASMEDLNRMRYLDAVIKESLRLHPPVSVHARRVLEDIEYEGGVIPAGITLVVMQYMLHRDEAVFPDPDNFDPERWLESNSQVPRNPYAYIPFSAGPRNCIGQKFAVLELKSAITKILRNYQLLPAEEVLKPKLVSMITLASLNGIHIQLKKRVSLD